MGTGELVTEWLLHLFLARRRSLGKRRGRHWPSVLGVGELLLHLDKVLMETGGTKSSHI